MWAGTMPRPNCCVGFWTCAAMVLAVVCLYVSDVEINSEHAVAALQRKPPRRPPSPQEEERAHRVEQGASIVRSVLTKLQRHSALDRENGGAKQYHEAPGRRPKEDTTELMYSRLGLHRVHDPDNVASELTGNVYDESQSPPPPLYLFDNDADITDPPQRPRTLQRRIGFRRKHLGVLRGNKPGARSRKAVTRDSQLRLAESEYDIDTEGVSYIYQEDEEAPRVDGLVGNQTAPEWEYDAPTPIVMEGKWRYSAFPPSPRTTSPTKVVFETDLTESPTAPVAWDTGMTSINPQLYSGALGKTVATAVLRQARLFRTFIGRYPTARVQRVEEQLEHMKQCPKCANGGWCIPETGECACPVGHVGLRCDVPDPHECSPPDGARVNSRCAGRCDTNDQKCYCGERGLFPNRPLRYCDPIGIAAILNWSEAEMSPTPWAQVYRNDSGERQSGKAQPWCDADPRKGETEGHKCSCIYEGFAGLWCDVQVPHTCPNQCNGKGLCRNGFCHCTDDWMGADCSVRAQKLLERSRTREAHKPLIYVYNLPPKFNSQVMQSRQSKTVCVHRTYTTTGEPNQAPEDSTTVELSRAITTGWYYSSELFLHEYLLRSPHRTLDPNKADYFYMPIYGSCYMELFNEPTPDRHVGRSGGRTHTTTDHIAESRPLAVAKLYQEAYEWVSRLLPYWNRTGGRDHVTTFAFDEGACFAPQALRNATLLTRWGQSNSHFPVGQTFSSYMMDQWDMPYAVDSDTGIVGMHPCVDPEKDIVIPTFKDPINVGVSAPPKTPRPKLFFFAGDLGTQPDIPRSGPHNSVKYSRGIRQALAQMWREHYAATKDDQVTVTGHVDDYKGMLASHKFCGALPGDGWSGGFESYVFAGCIPVVIMDGVLQPFETHLDFSKFTVRIQERDIPNLVPILRGISERRVAQMQQALEQVRTRFAFWVPLLDARGDVQKPDILADRRDAPDALSTLMDVLRFKLAQRLANHTFVPP